MHKTTKECTGVIQSQGAQGRRPARLKGEMIHERGAALGEIRQQLVEERTITGRDVRRDRGRNHERSSRREHSGIRAR